MGEEGISFRDHRMTYLLELVTHRWSKQVCSSGFKERSKGEAREILVNQQDQRIDLEVSRDCLFSYLYLLCQPLS